jgi:hypothetical protein
MNIGLLESKFVLGMAPIAEIIAFFLEKELGHETVPEVTFFAPFLPDDRVYLPHPQVSIRELLVAVKTGLRRKSLSL